MTDLKNYAKEAGGDGSHLPRTRYTFARIVSVPIGDITPTQSALDRQPLESCLHFWYD